ncbi:hypothetical protein A4H97_33170 [Niastella yeongjuensis]|uniref:DUF4258 domain-containing protein n=1 Tax=Niastella yeongjuensis TaxID=354355 RepID=A0A1V9EFX7_9BACT|nr:DUF4258 domain-containing protein [Niastella yeongjuensis]OQP45016.1 hypothetical protein A4H97_33170 [Niastella yeongjuensis]SEP49057.1 protein of unknown function [Niastella yeongjuensis]
MKRILTGFFLLTFLFVASCQNTPGTGNDSGNETVNTSKKGKAPAPHNYSKGEDNPRTGIDNEDVINRHPGHLIYTKHARCRMGCRNIDEAEVEEILEKGRINYRKSEPAGRPDPKYALEGTTHDGQQVRIIFAPAKRGMVVITVIDLDHEWSCDCK